MGSAVARGDKEPPTVIPSIFILSTVAPCWTSHRAVSTVSTVYNGVSPSLSVTLTSPPGAEVRILCLIDEIVTLADKVLEDVEVPIRCCCMPM